MDQPRSIRIGLCSDTHLWFDSQQRYGSDAGQLQPWSAQLLATLLAELQAAQPDYILHLGDISCGGGHFEMPDADFCATLKETFARFEALPARFLALPGNHDAPLGHTWQIFAALAGLEPGLGRTVDLPMARLVLLNAQGHSREQIAAALPSDPVSGYVHPHELARLEESLATAGGRPVLIFIHQLLQPWSGGQPWRSLYGVENGAAVLEIVSRYAGVRAVFQGHAHRFDVQQRSIGANRCWFVVVPPVIEFPVAWLQLDLEMDAAHVRLRRLPLYGPAEVSRTAGSDQSWRVGRPAWRRFTLPLQPSTASSER